MSVIMDEKEPVEKTVKRGGRTGPLRKRYTFEEKLRAAKLHLEEGFIVELVSAETGVRVILDEEVPVQTTRFLISHDVTTVQRPTDPIQKFLLKLRP
jgi:hypothetical protein